MVQRVIVGPECRQYSAVIMTIVCSSVHPDNVRGVLSEQNRQHRLLRCPATPGKPCFTTGQEADQRLHCRFPGAKTSGYQGSTPVGRPSSRKPWRPINKRIMLR